jgi:hypothetical protein
MTDGDKNRYHVRASDPKNDEQVAFGCASLAGANAKAAELRMSGYREVVISIARPAEDEMSNSRRTGCPPATK